MTRFIDDHPGGKSVIMREAGKDATEAFDAVHSRELLGKYKNQMCVKPHDQSVWNDRLKC